MSMRIFNYQNKSFPDAVEIRYRDTKTQITILGAKPQTSRTLRSFLRSLWGSPATGIVQTSKQVSLQSALFSIALSIKTYGMEGPDVLVVGTSDLKGNLVMDELPYQYLEVAKRHHCPFVLVPASWNDAHPSVHHVSSLSSAMRAILSYHPSIEGDTYPFMTIHGLEQVKRALLIALSGSFHILLYGPPGTGKSLSLKKSAECLPSFPCFSVPSTMEASYLEANHVENYCRRGMLLCDELTKLRPSMRTCLLSLMDRHEVMVASSMNLCPCGALGMQNGFCSCTQKQVKNYWTRLGFPLLDRYDIKIPVREENQMKSTISLPPKAWKERLLHARKCMLLHEEKEYGQILHYVSRQMDLSSFSHRSCISIARITRAIMDFDGIEQIGKAQVMEASSYAGALLHEHFWE
jgi:magnesium chelatase family protein